jgi:alcohol dehydrogenase (cytochrome c)
MTRTKVLMRSACVGAILAASGMIGGSAQELIVPASPTPVPGPIPDILQNYTPVTAERLKNPEDGNWLMFRRTYNGWGYSPLNEITAENVSRLQPVWSFATGQVEGHQAPPIVNNGVMFVATPGNQLLALDAKSGNVLWRYKRPFPEDMTPLHPTNRGVGLYGDKVFFAAAEAVLVALNAKTGKEVWTTTVDDYKGGERSEGQGLVGAGGIRNRQQPPRRGFGGGEGGHRTVEKAGFGRRNRASMNSAAAGAVWRRERTSDLISVR